MGRWQNRLAPPMISRVKLARSRELRKEATITEKRIWRLLRNRRMMGLKFKQQKVIAGFIVDFYCAELKRLRNDLVSEELLRELLEELIWRSPSPQRGEGVRG